MSDIMITVAITAACVSAGLLLFLLIRQIERRRIAQLHQTFRLEAETLERRFREARLRLTSEFEELRRIETEHHERRLAETKERLYNEFEEIRGLEAEYQQRRFAEVQRRLDEEFQALRKIEDELGYRYHELERHRLELRRDFAERAAQFEVEYDDQRLEEKRRQAESQLQRLAEDRRSLEMEYRERLAAAQLAAQIPRDPVRFHALWYQSVNVEEWTPLLIYLYSGWTGFKGARLDFERRMNSLFDRHDYGNSVATAEIQRGAEITIVPEIAGFIFNPPTARISWLEKWHCIEFHMQALQNSRNDATERTQGRVSFFVGPLLIAETEVFVQVLAGSVAIPEAPSGTSQDYSTYGHFFMESSSSAYRNIFVSYSHRDSAIVEQLEKAYIAIGDSYLRDVHILRSGEKWNQSLLNKIPRADVFQLCWSEAAKRSSYVEQEWRCAAGLNRSNFIRPMYWEKPLPEPPSELSHIHFTFVNMAS